MALNKLKQLNNKVNPFKKVGDAIQKSVDRTKTTTKQPMKKGK